MNSSEALEHRLQKSERTFAKALGRRDVFAANNIAMAMAAELFEGDPGFARTTIWERFYSQLTGKGVQYQTYDFESIDYELYEIEGFKRLHRGPKPDLDAARGKYITFLGASQLFGRHQQRPPHVIISQALGITCVNLSVSGAGPEYFCSEEVLQIANGGMAVVLQVLSGRSIGCEEYPGGHNTVRKDSLEKIKRLKLLNEIWNQSRQEAIRLTRTWQINYVSSMTRLLGLIRVPSILAWVSEREPKEWSIDHMEEASDFGEFPHLVDEDMMRKITGHCAAFVSVTRDDGLPHKFVSRFSGKNCPIIKPDGGLAWKNGYYCSSKAGEELSRQILAALHDMRLSPG